MLAGGVLYLLLLRNRSVLVRVGLFRICLQEAFHVPEI